MPNSRWRCARLDPLLRIAALLLGALSLRVAAACELPPTGTPQMRIVLLRTYDKDAGVEATVFASGNRFWIDGDTLASWRVAAPPAPAWYDDHGAPWYSLASIGGTRWRWDGCAQVLNVDLALVRRQTTRYSLKPAPATAPVDQTPGGFLNVDLAHSHLPGQDDTRALLDAELFNPYGRGTETFLVQNGSALRLDTAWSVEDESHLRVLRLGDSTSHPGSWGLPVRYAGVQWATDFGLQPYLSTFPQPVLRGDSALPSTLDVFVNQTLRGRQDAQPGPFTLSDVPAISGAGEVEVVVRDVLGRETLLSQPFYVSPQLLRPGLHENAVEAGWLRQNYGLSSTDYGGFMAAVTDRAGVTNALTREVRIEGQSVDGASAGAFGATLQGLLGTLGLADATLAYGAGPRGAGARAALGFERDVTGGYSFAARGEWAEPHFTQVGAGTLAPPRQRLIARGAMAPLAGTGLSLAYVDESRRDMDSLGILTAGLSQRLGGHLYLDASLTRAQTRGDGARVDWLGQVHLTLLLGPQTTASVDQHFDRAGDRLRLALQHDAPGPLGPSVRMAMEPQDPKRVEASGALGTERGRVSLDLAQDEQGSAWRLGGSTGFAFLGGHPYWTRPITGSFAVVDLEGIGGVGVYAENRLVTHTDARGTALVPELRPYEDNRIGIDEGEIPIQQRVDALSVTVVPARQRGVLVKFPADGATATLARIRLADGRWLPTGSLVRDAAGEGASPDEYPVGRDGEIFLEHAHIGQDLVVRTEGRECRVQLHQAGAATLSAPPVLRCELPP